MELKRGNCVTRVAAAAVLAALVLILSPGDARAGGYSLRFYGNGTGDIDRVKLAIDPQVPVDVGGDFTVEWWMKANPVENSSTADLSGGDGWIYGNIIFDRDVYGGGDYGDYGISLSGGRLGFGVHNGSWGNTVYDGANGTNVTDGSWHHVAVTRNQSSGQLRVYVDGALDVQGNGPTGNVSYQDGRTTSYPDSDPYLVIGAEKHDAGPAYPSYSGWIDEVRVSNTIRYSVGFTPPSQPFTTDADTVALYHLDEGSGDTASDSSGAAGGPSGGVRKYGGNPAGPEWTTDTPFGGSSPSPAPTPQNQTLIVPLGDSITQGDTGHNSYRRQLWQMLQEANYNVDFVGSMTANWGGPPPDPDFDLDHEGHWGWRTDQVLWGGPGGGKLSDWLQGYTPDIALIHLGHNDLWADQGVAGTIDELGLIIDEIRLDNPKAAFLLAQVIPAKSGIHPGLDLIPDLNAAIAVLAAAKDTARLACHRGGSVHRLRPLCGHLGRGASERDRGAEDGSEVV